MLDVWLRLSPKNTQTYSLSLIDGDLPHPKKFVPNMHVGAGICKTKCSISIQCFELAGI